MPTSSPQPSSKPTQIVINPECVKIGGDLVVGSLLSQVMYWHAPTKQGKSKLRVQRDGQWWIAKTREEWMAECGLTLKQYKRAVSVLKEKGLVEVKVMKFGGVAMGHLRLTRLDLLPVVAPVVGPKGTGHLAPKGPTGWAVKDRPLIQRLQTETTVSSGATAQEPPEKKAQGLMKIEDVLKKKAQEKAQPSQTLQGHWLKRMSAVYGGWQKPLTGKQLGQLKQLKALLGGDTISVIDYVVNYWMAFGSTASGGGSFPPQPDIGFLLKHCAVAKNLLQPVAPVVASAPTVVSPPVVESEEVPYQPTAEEVAAILAGLKE